MRIDWREKSVLTSPQRESEEMLKRILFGIWFPESMQQRRIVFWLGEEEREREEKV